MQCSSTVVSVEVALHRHNCHFKFGCNWICGTPDGRATLGEAHHKRRCLFCHIRTFIAMKLQAGNMMAQQGVIYPAEPLLIVDRQYRRKKSQKADTPTFSVQSTKRDITISVFGKRSPNHQGMLKTNARTKPEAQSRPRRSQKIEFVNATQGSTLPRVKKAGPAGRERNDIGSEATSLTVNNSPAESTPIVEPGVQKSSPLRLGGIVPSSSATFYGYAGSHIKSNAKDLLDYCMWPRDLQLFV